jgi:carbamoyl-phosphate synthase large subunit
MITVLVLGCDGSAGQNYARCLRMFYGDNIDIIGTGTNKYQLLACNDQAFTPPLYNDIILLEDMPFINKVVKITEIGLRRGVDFIHAQPEEEVEFLCRCSDENIPFISERVFGKNLIEQKFYSNKLRVQELMGFSTFSLNDIEDDSHFYRKMWVRAKSGAGSKHALPVTSFSQALNWADYLIDNGKADSYNDFIISPFLPGREFAVQLLYINGLLVHAQQRERLEHHFAKQMVSGQSSTPSVAVTSMERSVYAEAFEVVQNVSRELDVKPNGIYGVDIRMDENENPVVTEVNYGRYFTTSNFFATFSVNTPVDELQYAISGIIPSEKVNKIRPGLYWVRSLDSKPVWYTVEDLEEL